MLRLIGAIIVVLLIAAPLLLRAGVFDQAGMLREFVDLETRIFLYLVDAIRGVLSRHA